MTGVGEGGIEFAIEETVTDLVEMMFDSLTGDDERVDELIEELAEKLGLVVGETNTRYQELYARIVRAAWKGLVIKLESEMLTIDVGDLQGDFA